MFAISIVLATYNRRELLARTLGTIFAQEFPASEYEVVVVDDGSQDDTRDFLRKLTPPCAFQLHTQPNSGQTVALNRGSRAASGRLLLFLDDDLLCAPNCLAAHAAAHDGSEKVCFGRTGWADDTPTAAVSDLMRSYFDLRFARLTKLPSPTFPDDALVGPNCSLPRSLFLVHGGYNEASFPRRLEDFEMGVRLWKRGIPFQYVPSSVVKQVYTRPAGEFRDRAGIDGASALRLCRVHAELRPRYASHFTTGELIKGELLNLGLRQPTLTRLALATTFKIVSLVGKPECRLARRGLALQSMFAFRASAAREAGGRKALFEEWGKRAPVLLYHRIAPDVPPSHPGLTVTLRQFRKHLRWIAILGYEPIVASEWHRWRCHSYRLPKKPVLITFDDAYADTAKYAFPLLKQRGFRATVFTPSALVGKRLPWDGATVMNAPEIRRWSEKGFEFQAHSRTHPDLTLLTEAETAQEIADSKVELQETTGLPVTAFAYPHGAYNDAALRSVQSASYDLAFTIRDGTNLLCTPPHLQMRSGVAQNDTFLEFWLRLALGYNPLSRLRGGYVMHHLGRLCRCVRNLAAP